MNTTIEITSSKKPIPLRIAGSAKWNHGIQRLKKLCANGFDIELAPNPQNLGSLQKRIWPYAKRGVQFRFHAFFPGSEIGNTDGESARQALSLHMQLVDVISATSFSIITCHIGLTRGVTISESIARKHLGELVAYAESRGVIIALENLKEGPTSNPRLWEKWVRESGAAATLDLGHALSCKEAAHKKRFVFDIIDRIEDRLVEVHYYEKETDRHHAPTDMKTLGPVVDRLLLTACRWWTIELEDLAEMNQTRDMARDYLAASVPEGERQSVHLCASTFI